MTAFNRYTTIPAESEEQWIRREEEAERILERTVRERLAREMDWQDRYGRAQLAEENWVEVPEFTEVPLPRRVARMQMELNFAEVACPAKS